jgi:hypothetical protein
MKSLASAAVLSEVGERLLSLRVDDRALWGKMTSVQMVRHLGCACEMALGDRPMKPVKGPPPKLMRLVGLWSGLRWMKNYSTTPELKRAIAEGSDAEFCALVRAVIEGKEAIADGGRLAPSHPMFGEMRAADWKRWGYLHADHHLRQFGR